MERPDNRTLALFGGLAALLLLLGLFAATRDTEQDKLGDGSQLTADAGDPDLTKACSGQIVYEQIKRALFHQAARVRAGDQEAYEQIATAASVRMENPVAEGQDPDNQLVNCAGSLSIDLPPGVTTVAGRHFLMSDIYYGVTPKAGGASKVVQLRNADSLIQELSTLTLGAPPPAPMPTSQAPPDLSQDMSDDGSMTDMPPAPEASIPPPAPVTTALPSFDCANARTRGERAVCADPGLASLDRAMASEYRRALASSSPSQAATLRQTRDRFLGYRDNCPSNACIADSYTGRIREIRDIASGRWQPPR